MTFLIMDGLETRNLISMRAHIIANTAGATKKHLLEHAERLLVLIESLPADPPEQTEPDAKPPNADSTQTKQ